MIRVERVETYGWESAVRGMRNPLNSWEKSDSDFSCRECGGCYYLPEVEKGEEICWCNHTALRIGENDLGLMKRLIKSGSDHRKFMRQILVSMDIMAPLYWWKEFDTYKVGTTANSCSTMHKIHSRAVDISDMSHEKLDECGLQLMEAICDYVNHNIRNFNYTKEKVYWERIIQMLPSSYNQKRTVTLNYEVLRNMYHARKTHKLDEWREFCKVIEGMPYSELITMEGKV